MEHMKYLAWSRKATDNLMPSDNIGIQLAFGLRLGQDQYSNVQVRYRLNANQLSQHTASAPTSTVHLSLGIRGTIPPPSHIHKAWLRLFSGTCRELFEDWPRAFRDACA